MHGKTIFISKSSLVFYVDLIRNIYTSKNIQLTLAKRAFGNFIGTLQAPTIWCYIMILFPQRDWIGEMPRNKLFVHYHKQLIRWKRLQVHIHRINHAHIYSNSKLSNTKFNEINSTHNQSQIIFLKLMLISRSELPWWIESIAWIPSKNLTL